MRRESSRWKNTRVERPSTSSRLLWWYNHKIRSLPSGKMLLIEGLAHDVGLEIHIADRTTQALPDGKQVKFTLYWPEPGHWEDADFIVHVGSLRRDGHASAERSEANEE